VVDCSWFAGSAWPKCHSYLAPTVTFWGIYINIQDACVTLHTQRKRRAARIQGAGARNGLAAFQTRAAYLSLWPL
jgi:hypothetical protein